MTAKISSSMEPLTISDQQLKLWLLLLFLISLLYYFFTPVSVDIPVFFASAHLADIQYGGGLWGAIQSWELKPVANRIFIYIVYKLSSVFVDFGAKHEFLLSAKAVYTVLIFAASYSLSPVFTRMQSLRTKATFSNYFFLICSMLLLHSFRTILQAEFTALLFSFMALNFLLSPHRARYALGILFLSLIPFLKGITIVFAFQVLLLLFGFFHWSWKQLLVTILLCAVVCAGIVLCIQYGYPQEFTDLRDATSFQSSFTISLKSYGELIFITGLKFLLKQCLQFPLLPISLFALLFLLLRKGKQWIFDRSTWALLLAWIGGYLAVIVQHRFFVHHFVSLSLPMIFTVFFAGDLFREHVGFRRAVVPLSILSLLAFLGYTSPLQSRLPGALGAAKQLLNNSYLAMQQQISVFDALERAKPADLTEEEKVLYLDGGLGVWCWGTRSASRYYFPLPVQRSVVNDRLPGMACYRQVLADMNAFEGRYILFNEDWFKIPARAAFDLFREKLRHYERSGIVEGYAVYSRKRE